MADNKYNTNLSQSVVQGFYAEGSDLAVKTIVKAGSNENQRQACDAETDRPVGVVSTFGYENGVCSVIEKGNAEVVAGGVANIGDLAILDSTGQKVLSIEQDPDTDSDEINILGVFKTSASGDGKNVIVDVNPMTILNPKRTQKIVIPLGLVSATASHVLVQMPEAGTITAVKSAVITSITANDTNYWTEQLTNATQSKTLLAGSDANTTKATGGAGYTGNTYRSFNLTATTADRVVAKNDVLTYTLTKSASADNQVGKSLIIEYTKA
jgi:hypothetical protein